MPYLEQQEVLEALKNYIEQSKMTKVLGVTCLGKGKWLIMLAWDKQWPIPGTSSSGDRVGDR